MFNTTKDPKGYCLRAIDGDVGSVCEFFFDDRYWAIRYLVAETGNWLVERQVLVSPFAVTSVNQQRRHIAINLSKKLIEDSPPLESDRPVSRHFEEMYYSYYGWPAYWDGPYAWGSYPFVAEARDKWTKASQRQQAWDPYLRSTQDIIGNDIQALDGEIGHVEDFIVDEEAWTIRYLVVNTRNWWPGKKVLISPKWIDRLDWKNLRVSVGLTRAAIQNSPEFTDAALLTRDYETQLHHHYDRLGYWIDDHDEKQHR